MSATSKSLWGELDAVHVTLLEASDLVELLWMAGGSLSTDECGAIQSGASVVGERISKAKDALEKVIHGLKGVQS